jgi:hypothetical protein
MVLPFLFRLVVSLPSQEHGSCQPALFSQPIEAKGISRIGLGAFIVENTDYWYYMLFICIFSA